MSTKVEAIDRLQLAQDIREKAVEDGQRMGEALLYAEAKLGQLLKEMTEGKPKHHPSVSGSVVSLPEGITHKQSHFAQTLASHPEEIEEAIREARENEDIPFVLSTSGIFISTELYLNLQVSTREDKRL